MRYVPLYLLAPALIFLLLPFTGSLATIAGYSLINSAGAMGSDQWQSFVTDSFNWVVLGNTIRLAIIISCITLLIAYPTAGALAGLKNPVVIAVSYTLVFAPLLISVIVRTYGWFLLLSDGGLLNSGFGWLGIGPYRLIYNETGAIIAMVHVLLPFAVFPILSVMKQIPGHFREAAMDLGARRYQVFLRVSLPLTLPAVLAAGELIFALAVSSFVTPTILGGGRVTVLAKLIYDNIGNLEWGQASVQALVLLTIVILIISGFRSLGRLAKRGGV